MLTRSRKSSSKEDVKEVLTESTIENSSDLDEAGQSSVDSINVKTVERARSGTPIPAEFIPLGDDESMEEKIADSSILAVSEAAANNRRPGSKRSQRYFNSLNVSGGRNKKVKKDSPVPVNLNDPKKTAVQIINEHCPGLSYRFDDVRGPAHEPCFTVHVYYPPLNKDYVAIGGSKKVAKNNVAARILKDIIEKSNLELVQIPSAVAPISNPVPASMPDPVKSGNLPKKYSFIKFNPFLKADVHSQQLGEPILQRQFADVDFASDDVIMYDPFADTGGSSAPDAVSPDYLSMHLDHSVAPYGDPKLIKRLEKIKNLEEQACLGLNCIANPPDHPIYEEISESGPAHNKLFAIKLNFSSYETVGYGQSKKRAKADAARQILIQIIGPELFQQLAQNSLSPEDAVSMPVQSQAQLIVKPTVTVDPDAEADAASHSNDPLRGEYNMAFSDYIHRMVMQKYETLLKDDPDYIGQKVLAAIIMTRGSPLIDTSEVIVVTTGTKCVEGDAMSELGCAINDCHAEIIATRCIRDFFYNQLEALHEKGHASSIFDFRGDSSGIPFKLKEEIRFHLYISTSPCGDARIFSPKAFDEVADSASMDSHPNRSNRGLLRAKIEAGEGTIPVTNLPATQQTWDSILTGNALNTMSCSDKVCRWNVLGFQGSLLSILVGPVYYSSIILGSLHHPVHFRRAVYGRLEALSEKAFPMGFQLNNSYRLMTSSDEPRRVRKSPNHALTWCKTWPTYEILMAAKGRCKNGNSPSRICKRQAFTHFLHIRQLVYKDTDLPNTISYADAKSMATSFQLVKNLFNEAMEEQGFGKWISKPIEIDSFAVA